MKPKSKILVVDDNLTNINILEEILTGDYQLEHAMTGDYALKKALLFRPDVILLDIMMPGMDGYEVCERVRANSTICRAKIIMVSAKALVSERLQGYEVGADDYITKPFDENELLAKVRVYVRLKYVEELEQIKSDLLNLFCLHRNNPLSSVITPLEKLLEDKKLKDSQRDSIIESTYHSLISLQFFFEKIFTLSELKSGKFNFAFGELDLCEAIRTAAAEVQPKASAKGVVICQVLPESAITTLDWDQIVTVFITLLDNAVRHSYQKANVMVTASKGPDGYCVKITNKGKMIDPDFLPKLYDEFTYMDVSDSAEWKGLSLPIAQSIVTAHNGKITVDSTKKSGTTFSVYLPLASTS